jgi:predicted regulator of Ras-like GTPase activity (Roadblock/LC7/MglB family)
MADPVPTAASGALDELLEVSPQVDAAVILERDGGRLIASAPASSSRMADRFGDTCIKMLDAAEQARAELGREPVAQVEVATPDGHVFVVADARWVVAAVTDADPTVGLVFYDLKTALRSVREAGASRNGSNGSGPAPAFVTPAATSAGDDADADAEGASEGDGGKSNRWRRKKPS